jgi:hypothetical protein
MTSITSIHNKYKETFEVYIGRPSIFGNPFTIGKDGSREEVIIKYKTYFYDRIKKTAQIFYKKFCL